jgi:nucleoside 2-deoxyribosyltransferase
VTDSQTRRRCYVASPFGFTEGGRDYYGRVLLPALAEVVDVVDPWSLTSDEEVAAAVEAGRGAEMMAEIGRRNIDAIRSAEWLLAVLEGQEPDSGTVAELGYAAGLGLRCFGLRSDLRQAGEPGVPLNLQVDAFVRLSGGSIVGSLAELVDALAAR